ncbi:MAG: ABC-F family ATP-binding cassette domain-containing protein [Pyrinomonadaceae bacterium MAG19_C2-C3]|nr:ABC-F family ATP-binding cassette domain-containing protein [Pyrinomonadaceae bacterium MAG19_C2-C3]
MNIISLENVGKDFGVKPLFANVNIGFAANERIGIIGANGSGKTTFLRVVAGIETPDAGRVIRQDGKTLAYLSQTPTFDTDATIMDAIFNHSGGALELIRSYETACHDLAAQGGTNARLLETVATLAHELEATGAWEIETNARVVLSRLGIHDTDALVVNLSGGQRKRVALAHALIVKPDILILDEPTNHLDADTVEWLESYLARFAGLLLLVTHDRYFLDRVTWRILEIERGTIGSFDGGYAFYLEKKAAQEATRVVEGQKRKMLMRRELAWLRRGAKARTRKSKTRVDAARELLAQPVEKPVAEIEIGFGSRRLGTKVIELHHIAKSFDNHQLIEDFTYLLKRDDRIGIIGANGSGKTTLLEIIAGRIEPDTGHVEMGQTVRLGYYDQESRALNDDQRVIDYICEVAQQITLADGSSVSASQMLERFLFPVDAQYATIGKLSGGERRRLYLLRVLMNQPNVLLLDEPTNDLDIPTLIALEEYLDDFAGALIVVSHDRYLLDRTIDYIFRFEGDGRVREYPGDYQTYITYREREAKQVAALNATDGLSKQAHENPAMRASSAANADGASASLARRSDAPRKLSFKERRELETLEANIAAAEARQTEIERQLNLHATDAAKLETLFNEQQHLAARLAQDMERWLELA